MDKSETDTIKSNRARRIQYPEEENHTLSESMELNADADLLMETNERIPENETNIFESSTLTTKKNHAYTVWLIICFYLPLRLRRLLQLIFKQLLEISYTKSRPGLLNVKVMSRSSITDQFPFISNVRKSSEPEVLKI